MEENTPQLGPQTEAGHYRFAVAEEQAGERIDRFLAQRLEGFSRTRIKALVKAGQVKAAGVKIVEPNHRVKPGEMIEITVPEAEPAIPKPEAIPLAIVFEDDDVVVIDKPAGLVVHPAAGHWNGTLVNALIHHCGDSLSGIGGVRRPGIVHRLDKDTSGLMVVAKNDFAHRNLSKQFADHGRSTPENGGLDRRYLALIWGAPRLAKGRIETEMARKRSNRQKMAVVQAHGKPAITEYEVLQQFAPSAPQSLCQAHPHATISLIRCRLFTGRTHQIRVHMAHLGHPLLGDPLYGPGFSSKSNLLPDGIKQTVQAFHRQALHAYKLDFIHPRTGQQMGFESPPPQDFAALLQALEKLKIVNN